MYLRECKTPCHLPMTVLGTQPSLSLATPNVAFIPPYSTVHDSRPSNMMIIISLIINSAPQQTQHDHNFTDN